MAIFGLMTKKEVEARIKAVLEKVPGWLSATADVQQFTQPDPSLYHNQADLYRRLSWVVSAVDLVSQAAALQDFGVYKAVGEQEPEDIPNHPFEMLLRRPNPLDSRMEFLQGTIAMWKLTGNGYWWLNRASEYAPPDELWLIPSHQIQPVPDARLYLKGYLYSPGDGREIALEPWEIVHFKRYNPFSRFVGLSAIECLAMTAVGDMGMQAWNARTFGENNGRLPGILTFEAYPQDDVWNNIKQETRDAAKKKELMMLRGVGAGAVNWLQNAVSPKDMEFLSGREFNKEEIYGVLAPGAASVLDVNATEANAKTGRSTLMEYGVYPMLTVMGEKITQAILPSYGDDLLGEFDDPRVTDRVLELQEIGEYSKTHTVAEVRRKYYQDAPLDDERDDLFPVQVPLMEKTQYGEPEPVEWVEPEQENPEESAEGLPDEETPEDEETDEMTPEQIKALVELDRWQAKSDKAGKLVTWHNHDIPEDVYKAVKADGNFDAARGKIKASPVAQTPAPAYSVPDFTPILEAIKAEASMIVATTQPAQQPVSVTVHNHPGEAPVVNVAAAEAQKAETPVVNVTVSPTPVTVENTVNVPEQPAPDVNVTVEPAPVTVEKPRKVKIKKTSDGYDMEAK